MTPQGAEAMNQDPDLPLGWYWIPAPSDEEVDQALRRLVEGALATERKRIGEVPKP